jgi:hypothetical protein
MGRSKLGQSIPPEGIEGGAERLAEILDARAAHADSASLIPGDRALYGLLQLVYETSFKRDEGRFPTFCILVPRNDSKGIELSVRFEPRVELNSAGLHRLSAAVPRRPHALQVRREGKSFYAEGIGRFEYPGIILHTDPSETYRRAGGLVISVTGPGELTAADWGSSWSLWHGRVYAESRDWTAVSNLPWLQSIQREIERAASARGIPSGQLRQYGVVQPALYAWQFVLQSATELGHGATFTVLPDQLDGGNELPEPAEGYLEIAHSTTGPKLDQLVTEHALSRTARNPLEEDRCLTALLDAAKALAQLSAIDGSVVLDRRLHALGFGAKIKTELVATCIELSPELTETATVVDLSAFGTRHRSACGLGRHLPESAVFVISHEGDLRVFFRGKNASNVGVIGPMTAYSDHFAGR